MAEEKGRTEFETQLREFQLGKRTVSVLRTAQEIACAQEDFFLTKGPGKGDISTAVFIHALHDRIGIREGEQPTNGIQPEATLLVNGSGARVDFWIPSEQTIIEIALGLRNPLSEFERDVLKALIARDAGIPVSTLVLLGKPLALKRISGRWYQQVIEWAGKRGLRVCVLELVE